MKKQNAVWFTTLAMAAFLTAFVQASPEQQAQAATSGEIFRTYQDQSCSYHYNEESKEEFYLCLYLFPSGGEESPQEWTAWIIKRLPIENSDDMGLVGFSNDISWKLKREQQDITTGNLFANANTTMPSSKVNLDSLPCNTTSYVRAEVVSPVGCSEASCKFDTGVIQVFHDCGEHDEQ